MSSDIKNPSEVYFLLNEAGAINEIEGGEKFWSLPEEELNRIADGWMISEFEFDSDWQNWEMHPNGDEIVYILSGSVDFLLEENGGVKKIEVRGKGLIVVPRGTWHTAKTNSPCTSLNITLGRGTEHRPV